MDPTGRSNDATTTIIPPPTGPSERNWRRNISIRPLQMTYLPRLAFIVSSSFSILAGVFLYGAYSYKENILPIPQLITLYQTIREVVSPTELTLENADIRYKTVIETVLPDAIQPGLLLVAGGITQRQTSVKIMDRSGRVIHEWLPAWSEVWPAGEGDFPMDRRPVKGMHLHGIAILPDGDIVANFEELSTFRMGTCGDIKWKLDNLGHHSVTLSDDGTLWVAAEKYINSDPTGYPNHKAPLRSYVLQNLDISGKLLREIAMQDIFIKNDLMGILYLSSLQNTSPIIVSGDTLHLNDVEPFPASFQSDIFNPGDLLISLRNISTILVIDPATLKVKFLSIGRVMRQHDPDFGPHDKISVFDNRNFTTADVAGPPASRIVEIDAITGEAITILDGNGSEPFFTDIMGNHQRLPNGNLLVVSTHEGRVLEFTPDGAVAWRFDNRQADNRNLPIYNATVLPTSMDEDFFNTRGKACSK